jgi:RNA polymerase subunit RPABC4/transcription elongation factor Spt4
MVKEKTCLKCKMMVEGDKCPNCGETAFSEGYKGETVIFNPEKSIIAHNLKINAKGRFAIKTK